MENVYASESESSEEDMPNLQKLLLISSSFKDSILKLTWKDPVTIYTTMEMSPSPEKEPRMFGRYVEMQEKTMELNLYVSGDPNQWDAIVRGEPKGITIGVKDEKDPTMATPYLLCCSDPDEFDEKNIYLFCGYTIDEYGISGGEGWSFPFESIKDTINQMAIYVRSQPAKQSD